MDFQNQYKRLELRVSATNSLLELFPKASSRTNYLHDLVHLLQEWTDCRCAGVRVLEEDGSIPYGAYIGFCSDFWEAENHLSINTNSCACPRVMSGHPLPVDMPFLTPGGSFYTGDTTQLVPDDGTIACFRGTCYQHGFRSLAIIPIRYHGKTIGSIQLADERLELLTNDILQMLESLTTLIGAAVYKFNVEEQLRRNYDTQNVINSLLRFSLEDMPLNNVLQYALDQVLSIPWLSFEKMGTISLVNGDRKELELRAFNGIENEIKVKCARVPFGACYCGLAAQTQAIQYTDRVDEHHKRWYTGTRPHGHYCVPIMASEKLLGVLNIYVQESHRRNYREEEFLTAITNTLAGIIMRMETEREQRASESRYRALIKNSASGVFILDPGTAKIQEANSRFLSMLGYSEEEVTGRPIYDFINDSTDNIHMNLIKIAKNQHTIVGERLYRRKDGTCICVEAIGSFVTYGNSEVIMVNLRDMTDQKLAEEALSYSFIHLQEVLLETVNALTVMAEKRDPYTAGHQSQVANLSCAIAREMGLDENRIEGIRVAGMLHDIGKIYVPAEILSKPGKLSPIEFELIRTHPTVGYDILKSIPFDWPVADTVHQHQERLDGSGYPLQLRGDEILLEARILAVADVVDAITSHRPYRPSLGLDSALTEISSKDGIQYDSAVVAACLAVFQKRTFYFD